MGVGLSQSRVRFLATVIVGGHWYSPGQETLLPGSVAARLAGHGLVEKIEAPTHEARKSPPRGSRKVSRKKRSAGSGRPR